MSIGFWAPIIAVILAAVLALLSACLMWVVRTLSDVSKTLVGVQAEVEARLKSIEDRISPLEKMRDTVAATSTKVGEILSVKDRLGAVEVNVGRIDERTKAMVDSSTRIELTLAAALTAPVLKERLPRAPKNT